MWRQTFHAFSSRNAYRAACDAAGWPRGPENEVLFPQGVSGVEVGPIIERPTVDPTTGAPIPGEVLDVRHHVNMLWDNVEMPAAFQAAQVFPTTPRQVFALRVVEDAPPAVPVSIPAWKGKVWLLQSGKLKAAEAAVTEAGPVAKLIFDNAATWHRTSPLIEALTVGLALDVAAIDAAFIAADALQG